jgi:hypothetical protein
MSVLLTTSATRSPPPLEVCGTFKPPRRTVRSRPALPSRASVLPCPHVCRSPVLLTVLRRSTPTLNERRVLPLTAYPVTALHTGTDPRVCTQCWRGRSSENASSGLGCSTGCCSPLRRHRDHACRASLAQTRRALTFPPRERRMPGAARLLKHDRRLAARLAWPPRPPRVHVQMAHRRRVFVRLAHHHAAFSASPRPSGCRAVLRPAPRGSQLEPCDHRGLPLTLPSHASLTVLADRVAQQPYGPQGRRNRRPAAAAWRSSSLLTLLRPPPPLRWSSGRLRWRSVPPCVCVRHGRLEATGSVCSCMYVVWRARSAQSGCVSSVHTTWAEPVQKTRPEKLLMAQIGSVGTKKSKWPMCERSRYG